MIQRAVLVPVVVFAVLAAGALGVGEYLRRAELEAAHRQTSIVAEHAAQRLEDFVRSRLELVDVLRGERAAGLAATRAAFVARASHLQRSFSGFHAINWIDASGVLRWVTPLEPNRSAVGRNVFEHPVARPFVEQARDTGIACMTTPLNLFQGGRAFTTYFPAFGAQGELLGFVNGVFPIDRLVGEALRGGTLEDFELRVRDGAHRVFDSVGSLASADDIRTSSTAAVAVLGRSWELELRPRPATWSAMRDNAWVAVVVGGVSLAAAAALVLRTAFARQQRRQRELEERAELERAAQQARKLEAIGQLAGGVAHDFNNLMTSVSMNAELLLTAGLEPEEVQSVDQILQTARRATELTSQLLTFSRRQAVCPRTVELNAELRRFLALSRSLVPDGIAVEVTLGDDVGTTVIDPAQLDQVVGHLISNAVDAMPNGGRLRISTRRKAFAADGEPGPWAALCVEDDGEGLSEEARARAFDPFFTTKPGQGAGLGLSAVYGAVTAAKGKVTVESALGEGARFCVCLPSSVQEEVDDVAALTARFAQELLVFDTAGLDGNRRSA